MDESTKVQHFKSGIKPKANLEVALTTMRAGTVNVNDFNAVKSFLAAEIKARQARSDEIDNNRTNRYNVSQVKGGGKNGKNNNSRKGGKGLTGPINSATVDGKRVEGRPYPRNEWSKLTQPQRNKIKQLIAERKRNSANSSNNDATISSVNRDSIRDDMNTLANAIIAGVQRGSGETGDTESTTISTGNMSTGSPKDDNSSKRSAPAGSVGDIFGKRKKKE